MLFLAAAVVAPARAEPPAGVAKTGATRIAVVQLPADSVGDFAEMQRLAAEASSKDADLVVFPEASVLGWLNPEVFSEAQPIPGEHSDRFAQIAKAEGVWIATGLSERGPELACEPGLYEAFDSAILVNPQGEIVLHHRKHQVLKNAFTPEKCPCPGDDDGCEYLAGQADAVQTAETPFGRTALLVCADAYTYDTTVLDELKEESPELVIIPWGVAAGSLDDCGSPGFNAAEYAAQAAKVLGTAHVVGANGVGERAYGRFRPSFYCGASGLASPEGVILQTADRTQEIAYFVIDTVR